MEQKDFDNDPHVLLVHQVVGVREPAADIAARVGDAEAGARADVDQRPRLVGDQRQGAALPQPRGVVEPLARHRLRPGLEDHAGSISRMRAIVRR